MGRNATSTRWGAALAVVVAAGAGAWLWLGEPEPEARVASSKGGARSAVPKFVAREVSGAPAATPTEPLDEVGVVRADGRTEPIVDFEQEHAEAARAYRKRIADNIAHLEEKARIARAEGHPQRAALMEKRIAGLSRRLAEFEAELGEAP